MRSHRFLSTTALFSTSSIGSNKAIATFKPWPKPLIESSGDYSEEAFVEEVIGGPLYDCQKDLPHLPVPSIGETTELFLPSALPLAESKEEVESLINDCAIFPKQAMGIQKKLEETKRLCSEKNTSWLQKWWNQLGYLQIRDPVVVNVSYFFQLDSSDDVPIRTLDTLHDGNDRKSTTPGIKRGAAALVAMAEYRKLVCSGKLPAERIGRDKTPLCSVAFKYLFHSCRIPKPISDTFRIYDPSQYRHCVNACKNQFYAMDFGNENQDPLPLDVLENGLMHCASAAEQAVNDGTALPEIGTFTSGDRDSWAETYSYLLQVGGEKMKEALMMLESGAFLLCLDDSAPVSKTECANIYWHGNKVSGGNRWFDKSIQLLCQSNGKLGFVGEHSMADGMPAVALCNFIQKLDYKSLKEECPVSYDEDLPPIKNIFNDTISAMDANDVNEIQELSNKAKREYEQLVDSQELDVLSFQGYGSNYIKKAGYSPDGLVQMAIQLASFRFFGKQVATYESSQVRKFLHGRTETTRSVSQSSEAFVKAMGSRSQSRSMHNENDESIREEKLTLLKDATEYHSKYLKNAARGHGVDRHFFGLYMIADATESSGVDLFQNPLFLRSKRWRLSTSTLPNIPGFGPVVEDGVGIAYEVKPDCCFFTITARKKNNYTKPFKTLIEEALFEIQTMIDLGKPLSSKL